MKEGVPGSSLVHPFLTKFDEGEVLPHACTLEFGFAEGLRLTMRDAEQLCSQLWAENFETEVAEDNAYESAPIGITAALNNVKSTLTAVSLRTYGGYHLTGDDICFPFDDIKQLAKTFLSKLQNIANSSKGKLFPTKRPELHRTGVRLGHVLKLKQEHVNKFDKSRIFNPEWLAGFASEDDKLKSFEFQLVPNSPDSKEPGQTDLNMRIRTIGRAEIELITENGYHVKTSTGEGVQLEIKRGYLWDGSYNYDRLEDTLDFAERNYLEWFRKGGKL